MVSFQSALLPLACFLALVVGEPAQQCNPALCVLPDCRCAGLDIPGNLAAVQTPQIVTISMDDGIRVLDYELYYSQFLNVHRNPNNCPIQGTFFVSHRFSDYSLMERIVSEGHEIADHSVTHREPIPWWTAATVGNLTREIADMKTISERWGNVPEGHIRGFRVPFLAVSENEMQALHNEKFLYEASMPSRMLYWPFTLDYKSPLCDSPAICPDNSYPGLWIVPTPFLQQPSGPICGMLDSCTIPQNRQQWSDLLRNNFLRHYNGNRSPFGLYMHAAWFGRPGNRLAALNDFLTYLETLNDVYVVSQQKMLDWVRNPTPLSDIGSFAPWSCSSIPPPRCAYQSSNSCSYEETINVCDECPSVLPALGNPLGLDPAALAALSSSSSSEVMPTSTSSVEVASSSEVQVSTSVIDPSSTTSSEVVSESSSETSVIVGETTSLEPPVVSTSLQPPVESSSLQTPVESSSLEPPTATTSLEPPVVSTSLQPPVESFSLHPPVVSSSLEPPVESTSSVPVPTPVVDSSSQPELSSSPVTKIMTSTSQPPDPTNPPSGGQNGTGTVAPQNGAIDTTLVTAVGAGVGGAILLTIIGVIIVVVLTTLWVKGKRGTGKRSRYSYRYGGRSAVGTSSDSLAYRNPDII